MILVSGQSNKLTMGLINLSYLGGFLVNPSPTKVTFVTILFQDLPEDMRITVLSYMTVLYVGLQRYTGVPVRRDISCHDTNIVYWTSYCDIYNTFAYAYASTNMGKQSSISVSFRFLVLVHGDFPNKLTRKIHAEQHLVLYSRWRMYNKWMRASN